MSFGFSIGDAVLLTSLAWKTVENSRKACGEHDELTLEVMSLHLVLRRLEGHVIVRGCHKALRVLDLILRKYNALSHGEKSGRRLWQKIRFGNGEMADMADIRAKLVYYTSNISLFLNMISMGSVGRVENQMSAAGGELREIRQAINGITAHLMTRSREESVLTSYADDERAVWKEFRRELIQEGFSSSVIQTHKDLIKAYVRELGERGILDESHPEMTEESLENATVSDETPPLSEIFEVDQNAENSNVRILSNQKENNHLQTWNEAQATFSPEPTDLTGEKQLLHEVDNWHIHTNEENIQEKPKRTEKHPLKTAYGSFEEFRPKDDMTALYQSYSGQKMDLYQTPQFREYQSCQMLATELHCKIYKIRTWRQDLWHQISFPTNAFVVVSQINEFIYEGDELLDLFEDLCMPIHLETLKIRKRSASSTGRLEAAFLEYHYGISKDEETRLDEKAQYNDQLRDMSSAIEEFLPDFSVIFEHILTEVEISWEKVPVKTYLNSMVKSDLDQCSEFLDTIHEDINCPPFQTRPENHFARRTISQAKPYLRNVYPKDWDLPSVANAPRRRHRTKYDLSLALESWESYFGGRGDLETSGWNLWFLFHEIVVILSAIRKYLATSDRLIKHVVKLEEFYETGNRLLDDFSMIVRGFDISDPVHSHGVPFDEHIGSCECSVDTCNQLMAKVSANEGWAGTFNAYLNCRRFAVCYCGYSQSYLFEILRQANIELRYYDW